MKVRFPLAHREVAGLRCPFPVVTLRVRDRYGGFVNLPFRIDTQADLSVIPTGIALREGIPNTTDHPGEARGLAGSVAKFRDRIRVVR